MVFRKHAVRITLARGGLNIIRSTKTDKYLANLIKKLFGRTVKVDFDGVTDVDTESEEYRRYMRGQNAKQLCLRKSAKAEMQMQTKATPQKQTVINSFKS